MRSHLLSFGSCRGISPLEPVTERQRKRRGLVRQLDGAKLVSVDEKSTARASLSLLMTGV